jgi:hypothetical protein
VIPKLTPLRWFVLLAGITVALALGLPPDPHFVQQLHTSSIAYRVAVAALLVPYIVIWFFSFYTFAKLQEYSRPLKSTRDGAAFQKITLGMGAIAFSLIVPTMLSLVLSDIAGHHSGFKTAATIIDNYAELFPGLLSFLLLYIGTRALLRTTKDGVEKLDLRWHMPWFALLSIVFSHLTIENQYRSHPYHLSLGILIVTFITPYLYGWMVGLLSAYDLNLYAKTVSGTLYKLAIRQLARGISIVIISSILIQFANVTIGQRIH